jgi:hypothetical protein
VRIGVDDVALFHGVPHLDMALHHDVQHALVFVGELVLVELAEPQARLQHDFAGALLQLAAENLHEGGLAAAVGPDQAITVAVGELHRHLLEQRFGAELDGDVRGGKHGQRPEKGRGYYTETRQLGPR